MNNQNRADWSFKDWQKEDPRGLADLEKNKPNEFNNLFNMGVNSVSYSP